MSHSTLNFYKNTPILPEKNFMVDSLDVYLLSYTNALGTKLTISNFQYIKHSLNLEIKIDKSQVGLEFLQDNGWNYMSIQNSDTNARVVYYFIVNKEWRAQETLKLTLYLDTLNTFKYGNDYILSSKTKVMREHKDRYERLYDVSKIVYCDGEYDENSASFVVLTHNDNGTYLQVTINTGGSPEPNMSLDVKDWNIEYQDLNTYSNAYNKYSMTLECWSPFIPVSSVNLRLILFIQNLDTTDISDCVFSLKVSYNLKSKSRYYGRKIDYFNEGLNPILYKKQEEILNQNADFNTSWNLVYKGSSSVDCYLIPNDDTFTKQPDNSSDITIQYSDLTADKYYLIQYGMNGETIRDMAELIPIGSDVYIEADGIQYNPSYNSTLGWRQIRYGYAFKRPTGQNYLELYAVKQQLNRWTNVWDLERTLITTNIPSFKLLNTNRVDYLLTDTLTADELTPNSYFSRSGTSSMKNLKSVNQLDRTDSTLIKIIKLPYCPSKYTFDSTNGLQLDSNLWEYDSTYNAFKLISNYTELTSQIITENAGYYKDILIPIEKFNAIWEANQGSYTKRQINSHTPKDIQWESKLYHSSFYQKKFVYDSFAFVFQEEKIDVVGLYDYLGDYNNRYNDVGQPYVSYDEVSFRFDFTATKTINSKFLFTFFDYFLKMSEEDFDNILPVARNNEEVIYNSDYITYLRTGYNYDLKAKERTEKLAGLQFGVETGVGAIKSAATTFINWGAGALSWGSTFASTITGITQLTNTIAQAEDSVERKIASMKAQAISVAGSDDIDLLLAYSDNKAKLCTYQASDRVREMLFDLFYYTGYATGEMKVPALNTRYWFNFIQAEIVIKDNLANIPQTLLDNIAERFMAGITNLHKGTQFGNEWNFNQTYENWESWLLSDINS